MAPAAVDLRGAVARIDLQQALTLGVVLPTAELNRERGVGRRVDSPARAVGNHEGREPPLRQLLEQDARGLGSLEAVFVAPSGNS